MIKTPFTLREYQKKFIKELAIAIKQFKRVIGCAATGSGKSKTFIQISVNALSKNKEKIVPTTVLIITESRKIFSQLIEEVHAVEIKDGSKLKHVLPGCIFIAMAQTLIRRKKLIEQFNSFGQNLLVINDEAHINVATNILLQLPSCLLIGFTATPIGKHLVKCYNEIVIGPQPHELVLDGFLCSYKHFERKRADISQLEIDSTGEFSEESQNTVFNDRYVFEGLIEDLRTIKFKKAIIYCSSIARCEEVTEQLKEEGFHCVAVHSKLKEDVEEKNLKAFKEGLIPICVSVGILTKGFDFPPIDLVVLYRATTSLSLYLQMCGRGSRLSKETLKEFFTVLDYGGNCTRHLPWDWERDWREMWRAKPKRQGVAPIKVCPQCNYVNNNTARKCVNCGYEFLTFAVNDEEPAPESILIEITKKYQSLVGRNITDLSPAELAIYSKSKNKKGYAMQVIKFHLHNEKNDFFLRKYAEEMNYKMGWCTHFLDRFNHESAIMKAEGKEFEFKSVILK